MQGEKGTLRERGRGESFPEEVPAGPSVREGQFPGRQGVGAGQGEQYRQIHGGTKQQGLCEEA